MPMQLPSVFTSRRHPAVTLASALQRATGDRFEVLPVLVGGLVGIRLSTLIRATVVVGEVHVGEIELALIVAGQKLHELPQSTSDGDLLTACRTSSDIAGQVHL